MKSVIALLFTLLASASAFAPMQQTVGTYNIIALDLEFEYVF
jgi:hypothetical protein